jgi:hypothetical protein
VATGRHVLRREGDLRFACVADESSTTLRRGSGADLLVRRHNRRARNSRLGCSVLRTLVERRHLMRSFVCLLLASGVTAGAFAAVAKATEPGVVLGARAYAGSQGVGWGKPHPSELFNGGDPSGLVSHIDWLTWGGASATGHGLNAIFKPRGGYYSQLVRIQLHAYDRGRCTPHGPLAYRKLSFREPSRPGGHVGVWRSWSGSKTLCRSGF